MNKQFQLLKDLLLHRECGGYDIFNSSISLAIDIVCEAEGIERNDLIQELKEIHHISWNNYCEYHKPEIWERNLYTYERLIDAFYYKNLGQKDVFITSKR